MYSVTIKIANIGAPLTNDGTGNPGASSLGHMWYEINDGSGGQPTSFGFGPVEHGAPLGPGTTNYTDSNNYS